MKIRGREKESLSLPRLPWLSVWAEVEHTIRMCRLGHIDPGCAGEHVHLHHSRQDCYLGCNASLKILPLSNNGAHKPMFKFNSRLRTIKQSEGVTSEPYRFHQ